MKAQYLWFCNDYCFDNYLEFNRIEREYFIHDSTNDPPISLKEHSMEVGCTKCKIYTTIDNQKDSFGKIKNFEYLALFLCEHVGHDHLLKVNIGNRDIPWKETKLQNEWKEYEY